MKNIVYGLLAITLCIGNAFAQGSKKVQDKRDSLFYDGKLDLNFVVSSRKYNPRKSPFETSFENPPKPIDKTFLGTGFYLKLDTIKVLKDKNGYFHKLLVVNTTDSSMAFRDLDILPEVLIDGKWEQVHETKYEMPFSYGYKDYKSILDPKEYWSFNVPVFKGNYKTKLRYTLYYENEYIDFSSNEIDVYFNKGALDNKYLSLDPTTNYLHDEPVNNNQSIVSLDKMNVVYVGLSNPITIAVPGYSPELVTVKPSCGKMIQDVKRGSYKLTFDSAYNKERQLEILVYVKTTNDSIELKGTHAFRIRSIPTPSPMLGSIDESGVYSLGVIKSAGFVFLNLKNFAFDGVKYTPLEYTLRYEKLDGQIIELKGKGAAISKEMRRLFNHAKSGERFTLGDITALGPIGIEKIDKKLTIEVK